MRDSIENLLKSRNNNNGRRGAKEGLVSCEFNCLMTQTSEEQFLDHFSITFWQDRCYKTFLQNRIFYPKILFLDLPKIDLRMSTLGDLPTNLEIALEQDNKRSRQLFFSAVKM